MNAQFFVELDPNLLAALEAICPGESVPEQISATLAQRDCLLQACTDQARILAQKGPL